MMFHRCNGCDTAVVVVVAVVDDANYFYHHTHSTPTAVYDVS
jgi:hypothetical protein